MLLLHLSDLHLSRYGETRKWTQVDEDPDDWESLHTWRHWRIDGQRDRKGRPDKLRLVDPVGIVHTTTGWPSKKEDKAIAAFLELAMERQRTSTDELISHRPSPEDIDSLLRIDPDNTNLRFLQLLDQLLPLEPDIIAVTGDLTDNGLGYGLVEHYLEPWIKNRRLLVVPGNHDTYEMFPGKGRKARLEAKLERYQRFAESVGMAPDPSGAFVRTIDDLAFIGLSSCKPPRTPLSASGEVDSDQLERLEELSHDEAFMHARLRIGLVHHHLLRMPFELGKRMPVEMGLRLRNAREFMAASTKAHIDVLLNGHRHHGYMVKLPGHPLVISSPSSTLGCKSTEMRYVWLVNLDHKVPHATVHRFTEDRASDRDDEDETE
ncbi:MAG: metallophosphoesterase [Deltaproteobacteria bacterium]|nr:metallophosphoesterase [Deltaproteobacteria bacterium]